MVNKDSISNTFIVAGALCIVCSLLVSMTAVGLRSKQKQNVVLDKKKNILLVAGFSKEEVDAMKPSKIESFFDGTDEELEIEDIVINLSTGEKASEEELEPVLEEANATGIADFDQEKIDSATIEGRDSENQLSRKINPNRIGLKTVENYSHVYVVKNKKKGTVDRYVFPVKGKGLWSTLFGYLAVNSSFERIEGLTFYQHAETPGLGGEVDNPNWKKMWEGLQIYTESGELADQYVTKGPAPEDNPHAVDGLSGATITSKGVSSLVRYWLGEDGFGEFIKKRKPSST